MISNYNGKKRGLKNNVGNFQRIPMYFFFFYRHVILRAMKRAVPCDLRVGLQMQINILLPELTIWLNVDIDKENDGMLSGV